MIKPAVLALFLGAPALAMGPLNPALVRRDAAWVVHLDVEAGVKSALGEHVLAGKSRLRISLEDMKKEIGLDVLADVRSLTVYGLGEEGREGVVIVAGTEAVDAVVERLRKDPTYAAVEDGGRPVHSWVDHGRAHFAQVRPGANGGERIVFIARSLEHLRAGLDVPDGRAPNLAGSEAPRPAAGSIMFISVPSMPAALRRAPDATGLLGLIEGLVLDLGEQGGDMYADLSVHTAKSEDANNLLQAAAGFIAMARLLARGEEDSRPLSRLCDAVTLSAEGTRLTARFRCSAREAVEAMSKAKETAERLGDHDRPRAHPQPAPADQGGR
jgi:hypothetical protein